MSKATYRRRTQPQGTIYLLCFSSPLHHARHYLGWAADLAARLDDHRNGTGARLTQVIAEKGITFQLARTWTGTRSDERRLKNRKEAPKLCPFCSPQAGRRAKKIN